MFLGKEKNLNLYRTVASSVFTRFLLLFLRIFYARNDNIVILYKYKRIE